MVKPSGRPSFQVLNGTDPHENIFHEGVRAYLKSFRDPPPKNREVLEAAIQWMDPAVQNPIFEAIWWNGYEKFADAVNKAMADKK